MQWIEQEEVIGGKRYSTDDATLIAADDYWDGRNWERKGRNTFLFRTAKGAYFTQKRSQFAGEDTTLTPVTVAEAVDLWPQLTEREMTFEEAFPGVIVEDA